MHFHTTFAAAAGAALFSVAAAGPVCRLKSSPGTGGNNAGWTPANVQPAPQQPGNNGGWSNWDGSPIVIRTTTLSHTSCNPLATGTPRWGGWNGNPSSGAPVSPTGTSAPGQVWNPWSAVVSGNPTQTLTLSSVTTTISGTVTVLPTAISTTTTTTLSTITVAPTSITTTTASTTTTTTTTTTTVAGCPNAPTGVFYLQAQNAENTAINNYYAGLANNGYGNLVAFSEVDTTNAIQVTFDATCELISAFGPLIILDDGTQGVTFHYQYMNEEGTQAAGTTRSIDICSADASNVLTCTVNGENVLQTSDDILSIGDALYDQTLNVVLVPV